MARSFSKGREAAEKEFAHTNGFLMVLEKHRGLRDFEPVVNKVAPQYAHQRELLAVHGQRFIYLGETLEGDMPVLIWRRRVIAGNKRWLEGDEG